MASFHNWTGDEEIDTQVPQFLNEDNIATQEKLDTKFNKSLEIAEASDLNNFKNEGFYYCNSNSRAETILNCPTNYAFGLMVWGKGEIVYQEVREYNRSTNNLEYNNCWRRSYYSGEGVQGTWSKWQKMSYSATTLAGYGITDGMSKSATNSVSVADILKRNINTSYLRLTGGMAVDSSANLQLCGCNYTGDIADAGQFSLEATDSMDSAVLLGTPSGVLKWNNKNIVRSINNSVADENGNVTIDGNSVIVDTELSGTSTNPVQNKVIKEALDNKLGVYGTALIAARLSLIAGTGNVDCPVVFQSSDLSTTQLEATYNNNFKYNPVTDNLTVGKINGFTISTSVPANAKFIDNEASNVWTAQQDFYDLMLNREKYTTYAVIGTSDTPMTSTMVYNVTGAFTLNLATLAGVLSASQSSVFTAYFAASADYALTITNAGTLKYVGSASDVAITSAGLLLNIWMSKDGDGTLTSIVQANKLGGDV